MLTSETYVRNSYRILKATYGVVPIVAGLDKFTEWLVDWSAYLNPWVAAALPFSAETFMGVVGVIEIFAGLVVLSRWTRWGAWIVAAWLASIALNLVIAGHYDIAVRDLVMAIGAYRLARAAELVSPVAKLSAGANQQKLARTSEAST